MKKNNNYFDKLPDSLICFSIMPFLTPREKIVGKCVAKDFLKNKHIENNYPTSSYWLRLGAKTYYDFKERVKKIEDKSPELMNALLDNNIFVTEKINDLSSAEYTVHYYPEETLQYLSGKGPTLLF